MLVLSALPFRAQIPKSALSEAEVEQIRDARYVPSDCILLFVKFLDVRTQKLQDLYSKPRHPGREEDTRELLAQFTSIADELSDNLDDYGPRHADLRKALPKIVDAAERWSSTIKSPPSNETYEVARKIALESIRDLREDATELRFRPGDVVPGPSSRQDKRRHRAAHRHPSLSSLPTRPH